MEIVKIPLFTRVIFPPEKVMFPALEVQLIFPVLLIVVVPVKFFELVPVRLKVPPLILRVPDPAIDPWLKVKTPPSTTSVTAPKFCVSDPFAICSVPSTIRSVPIPFFTSKKPAMPITTVAPERIIV